MGKFTSLSSNTKLREKKNHVYLVCQRLVSVTEDTKLWWSSHTNLLPKNCRILIENWNSEVDETSNFYWQSSLNRISGCKASDYSDSMSITFIWKAKNKLQIAKSNWIRNLNFSGTTVMNDQVDLVSFFASNLNSELRGTQTQRRARRNLTLTR